MDPIKIGMFIHDLRKENHLTQLQLAEKMHISDKTISKWERGQGCPDVSLLLQLAELFELDLEKLVTGNLNENQQQRGNMKKLKIYICAHCGNMITTMDEATVSCCGKKLQALEPKAATEDDKLQVELLDHHYFITTNHPMTREHYITFVALKTGDAMFMCHQYPEWDLQTKIPEFAHGMLIWHCSVHGLLYQWI